MTRSLEGCDALAGSKALADFIDELSNWYVRRSRDRFWGTSGTADPLAFQMLYHVLVTTATLLAPYCPFMSEEIYRNLVCSLDKNAPDSVHLHEWPVANLAHSAPALEQEMAQLLRVVSLARSARAKAGLKVRQPLRRILVQGVERLSEELLELGRKELNVKELQLAAATDELVRYEVRPIFRALGERLGRLVPKVQAGLKAADPLRIKRDLKKSGSTEVMVDGEVIVLSESEVEVRTSAPPGWIVSEQGGITVAIDLTIDAELKNEGRARDIVRKIQVARRESGLRISDRIEIWLDVSLDSYTTMVAREVLAASITIGRPLGDGNEFVYGEGFAFRKMKEVA